MPAKPWFPTFVYESPLQAKGNDDVARALLAACQEVRDADDDGRLLCQDNYPAGYTSYQTRRDLHRTSRPFVELERKLWNHVRRFARRLEMDLREVNLAMTDCWVNIMSSAAVHPMHLHPGAAVSGTYYVHTPPGCSGLSFEDPRAEQQTGAPPRQRDCRPENRQRVSYPVTTGNVILFESWLRHGVLANPTEKQRVSVSFNYTWV